MDPCIAFASPERPYMTKLWGPGGPKAHTVQHFGPPEEQQHAQYSTLRARGGKSVHSRTLWGPGPEKTHTVQHFGAPGTQTRAQYSTSGPRGSKHVHSTTLWQPGGPKAYTVQHLGGPGGPIAHTVQHFGAPEGLQTGSQLGIWKKTLGFFPYGQLAPGRFAAPPRPRTRNRGPEPRLPGASWPYGTGASWAYGKNPFTVPASCSSP